MPDRLPTPVPQKTQPAEKINPPEKPKVKILYPQPRRNTSPSLYYPTDRYRLSAPLFPDPNTLKISGPQ